MANDFFFFTDINQQASGASDYINVQPPEDAFGPITSGTAGMDEYSVTSLHKASYNPTAYALCDAIVCVQRIPGTTPPLVNVILKPLVQPALNFAPIKYIIYKGILANSLIATNGTDAAATGNNELTTFLWDEQAKKNKSAGTTANPPAEALGVGLTAATLPIPNDLIKDPFNDDQPIDNLFYRSGVSFQLPKMNGGSSIGQFDKTGFGMEVLMEGLSFHHSLSLTRQLENKISVQALVGGETDAKQFDHWHAKEQVLGFMDPCAFYGSFFLVGIQAKTSGNVPFVPKSGNALYNDVLFAFANKNTAYLDIRNEHNFSFNYFKNYGRTIKLGSSATPVDYYASNWPIMTLPASTFAAANTNQARNTFRIQLPIGDNPKPLLYVSQGYRDINSKGDEFPAELSSAERFYDAFELPAGGYTTTKGTSGLNSMAFVVPNVTAQSATTPASCYIRLKYLKQQHQQAPSTIPTVIQSATFLDNLIYPIDLRIPFAGLAPIKSFVYDEEIYVNAQDVPGLNCDFIGKTGIARDADNTYFFTMPVNIRTSNGQVAAQVSVSGETGDNPGGYPAVIAAKYPALRVRKSDLTLSGTGTVNVAEVISDADTASQAKFDAPELDKFVTIAIANAAYDAWKTKIETAGAALDNRFRIYLGIENLFRGTDLNGIGYMSFELVLRGFTLDVSTDSYKVSEMNSAP